MNTNKFSAISDQQSTPVFGGTRSVASACSTWPRRSVALHVALLVLTRFALPSFAATVVTFSVDGGGGRNSGGPYLNDSSIGAIGGVSMDGTCTLKPGYVGQLTEMSNLVLIAVNNPVNEGGTNQLGGIAGLDDATVVALEGSNIVWSAPVFPVSAISSAGLATMANVYDDTSCVVTGRYLGITGSGALVVLDSNPDNYGSYAGDGLPDWWQNQYFGLNNPNAVPANNPDGDWFDNTQEYVADTNPTNPASFFSIVAISNAAPAHFVYFNSSAARVYTLLCATNLVTANWTNVTVQTDIQGAGTLMTLVETNGFSPRFYRVTVRVP